MPILDQCQRFVRNFTNEVTLPVYIALGRVLMRLARKDKADNIHIETFRKFLHERQQDRNKDKEPLGELLYRLERNLDAESCYAVERYLLREFTMIEAERANIFSTSNSWKKWRDEEEITGIKRCKEQHCSYLNLNDNGITFLPQTVQTKLAGTDFVDGGAFVGDSIPSLLKYKPAKIFAFEPDEQVRKILTEKCAAHHWQKNVVPVGLGLAEGKKSVSFAATANSASIILDDRLEKTDKRQNDTVTTIQCTDIDSFVRENGVNLGCIKMDIEGLESAAIHGAVESIKKYRPVLLISIYHTPDDFFRIKPFIEDMNLDYQFLIRKLSPQRLDAETMLIGWTE
jgi:FkbM family methyltransferase